MTNPVINTIFHFGNARISGFHTFGALEREGLGDKRDGEDAHFGDVHRRATGRRTPTCRRGHAGSVTGLGWGTLNGGTDSVPMAPPTMIRPFRQPLLLARFHLKYLGRGITSIQGMGISVGSNEPYPSDTLLN